MNDPTKRLIMLTNVLRDVSQGVSSGLHEPDAQVLRRETRLHDVASRLHTSVQDARGEDETERRRAQERLVAATLPRLEKRAAALRRAVEEHLAEWEDEAELMSEFDEYAAGARTALQAIADALDELRAEVGPLVASAAYSAAGYSAPAASAASAALIAAEAAASAASAALPAHAAHAALGTDREARDGGAGAPGEPGGGKRGSGGNGNGIAAAETVASPAATSGSTNGTGAPRATAERTAEPTTERAAQPTAARASEPATESAPQPRAERATEPAPALTTELTAAITNAIAEGIQAALGRMLPRLQAALPALVAERPPAPAETRGASEPELWSALGHHSEETRFARFDAFVDAVFAGGAQTPDGAPRWRGSRSARTVGDPYQLLKVAADAFLLTHSAVWSADADEGRRAQWTAASDAPPPVGARQRLAPQPVEVPDLRARLAAFLGDDAALDAIVGALGGEGRGVSPFAPLAAQDPHVASLLDLLWSYWHEEGMLAQSLIAVALRFQDVRRGARDPLAELDTGPLRPLSRVLWGFIQDEPNRLSVARRAHEYNHAYALALRGRAIPPLKPAGARSRFLSAFHTLLRRGAELCARVDGAAAPDPYAVLNALKELHLLLAGDADNQVRDVPWTARSEMLVQQWILSRPEVREFLRGASTPAYPEGWMGAVDAMRRLQGWGDASVVHFHDLAVVGERLLLGVRHFPWLTTSDPQLAAAWALHFRADVRGYVDAYRAVTGVDLAAGPHADATPPSELLHRRSTAASGSA